MKSLVKRVARRKIFSYFLLRIYVNNLSVCMMITTSYIYMYGYIMSFSQPLSCTQTIFLLLFFFANIFGKKTLFSYFLYKSIFQFTAPFYKRFTRFLWTYLYFFCIRINEFIMIIFLNQSYNDIRNSNSYQMR